MILAEIHTDRDVERLNGKLSDAWRQLFEDDAFAAEARAAGVDVGALAEVGGCPFEAREPEGGNRADVETAILIAVAGSVASDVARSSLRILWARFLKDEFELWFGPISPPRDESDR